MAAPPNAAVQSEAVRAAAQAETERLQPLIQLLLEAHERPGTAARSRDKANALVVAAELQAAPDSLVLADALLTQVTMHSLPLIGAPPKTRAQRCAQFTADPTQTLEPSRRLAALLARRAAAGTLYELSVEETAYMCATRGLLRVSRLLMPSSLLACSCLFLCAYWPPALRASDEARDALVPALRALVHGSVHGFSASCEALVQMHAMPGLTACPLEGFVLDLALEAPSLTPWARAAVTDTLCMVAIRHAVLGGVRMDPARHPMLDPRQAMLVEDARAGAPAVPKAPRPDAATVAAAAKAAKAVVKPLLVLHARYSDAVQHFRMAVARNAVDALVAAVEAALPGDSLVLVDALNLMVRTYSSPLDMLTPHAAGGADASDEARRAANKAAWRDDPEHTLVPARRAASILVARAAAGTLLCLSPEEDAYLQLGQIHGASPYVQLVYAVNQMRSCWPPELRDSEEGTALLTLALNTLVEGGASQYVVRLTCSAVEGMCFEGSSGPLARTLLYPALEDAHLSQRARSFGVDRAALRELVRRYAAAPHLADIEAQKVKRAMEAEAAQRLQRQGGQLRTCGREACAAVEIRAGQFKLCGACRGAVYCGAACQTADWPSHKAACKAARKAAEDG